MKHTSDHVIPLVKYFNIFSHNLAWKLNSLKWSTMSLKRHFHVISLILPVLFFPSLLFIAHICSRLPWDLNLSFSVPRIIFLQIPMWLTPSFPLALTQMSPSLNTEVFDIPNSHTSYPHFLPYFSPVFITIQHHLYFTYHFFVTTGIILIILVT